MKKVLLPVLLMLLAGCFYEIPLSQTAITSANPALAGTWERFPANKGEKPLSMKIETSGTDYYIRYTPEGDDSLLFKGFEISVAGLNMIQLEWLNSGKEKSKYLFVKYELTSNGLMYYFLNTDAVSSKCQSAEVLLNEISLHRQDPSLFVGPETFVRSAHQ
jgi:hypothetical protein